MPVWEDVHSRRILRDIVHVITQNEVSALTPQMDLSPCTRVYIQGGQWSSHLFGFWPIWSGTILQIPIKRSLDLFRLMWWLSYVEYQCDMWRISHLLGSDVSMNLWKDLEDHGGACLSLSYTSNMRFSESRLLAIIGLPWPMTPLASMLSGTMTREVAIAAKAAMAVVSTMTWIVRMAISTKAFRRTTGGTTARWSAWLVA